MATWEFQHRPPLRGTHLRRVVGPVTATYGVALSVFWAVVLLWAAGGASGFGLLAALGFLAVAVLLVVTGVAVHRGLGRTLAYVTAGILGVKSAAAGLAAFACLRDTGPYSGVSHALGWLLLAVVVAPSLTCAVALAGTVRHSGPRGPDADDYDDARLRGG